MLTKNICGYQPEIGGGHRLMKMSNNDKKKTLMIQIKTHHNVIFTFVTFQKYLNYQIILLLQWSRKLFE